MLSIININTYRRESIFPDCLRSHRKALGYRAGTKADPNAITPQQARTAFARYCEKIDVTKEELAWNIKRV